MTDTEELRRSLSSLRESTERLRELAEQATPGPWAWSGRGNGYIRADKQTVADMRYRNGAKDAPYIAAANPATILSLLDRLDRALAWEPRAIRHGQRVAALEEGLRRLINIGDSLWEDHPPAWMAEADQARSLLQSSAARLAPPLRGSQGDEE